MRVKDLSCAFASLVTAAVFAAVPSGNYNTWLGNKAGTDSTGSGNTYLGSNAGQNSAHTKYAVNVGMLAGNNLKTNECSVSVGYGAGTNGRNFDDVVAVGTLAGYNAQRCTNCVFIGKNAGRGMTDMTGAVVIGDVLVHTNGVTTIKGFRSDTVTAAEIGAISTNDLKNLVLEHDTVISDNIKTVLWYDANMKNWRSMVVNDYSKMLADTKAGFTPAVLGITERYDYDGNIVAAPYIGNGLNSIDGYCFMSVEHKYDVPLLNEVAVQYYCAASNNAYADGTHIIKDGSLVKRNSTLTNVWDKYITASEISNEVANVAIALYENDVTAINDMVDSLNNLPLGTGATTIGAILLALASAVAWLKKKKLTDNTADFDEEETYAVGDFVKYQGALYVCHTAITTAGAWTGVTNWSEMSSVTSLFSSVDTSTDPAASGLLSNTMLDKGIVKVGNTLTRYSISTTSSATMADRTTNVFTMAANTELVLPSQVTGKMRDFLLVLTYTSGTMTLPSGVTKVGDTLSFTAGKTYLIAFTEISANNFYVRSIQLD